MNRVPQGSSDWVSRALAAHMSILASPVQLFLAAAVRCFPTMEKQLLRGSPAASTSTGAAAPKRGGLLGTYSRVWESVTSHQQDQLDWGLVAEPGCSSVRYSKGEKGLGEEKGLVGAGRDRAR